MGQMYDLIAHVELPNLVKIRQNFDRTCIEDVDSVIAAAFAQPGFGDQIRPGTEIALAVGSRGVARINEITRAVVREVRARGAVPFVVPSMGSHGGATAEGQVEVLAGLGVTEEFIGCEIRSSMDVEDIGAFTIDETGAEVRVYIDKLANAADGIIPIARVKPHTSFRAPVESGLCKMLTIGLGKQKGANACHQRTFQYMYEMITKAARIKIQKCRILFGIATVENAYDKVYHLEAVRPEHFLEADRRLLELARSQMAVLKLEPLDALVVQQFGKDISGDGMDPNVVGKSISNLPNVPRVNKAAVLDLTEGTHGNASGIGGVEVITKRLLDKIDFRATYANGITTTGLQIARIPMVMENDREAIMTLVACANAPSFQETRMTFVKDSLHMEELYISEAMLPDAQQDPTIDILSDPFPIPFDAEGNLQLF